MSKQPETFQVEGETSFMSNSSSVDWHVALRATFHAVEKDALCSLSVVVEGDNNALIPTRLWPEIGRDVGHIFLLSLPPDHFLMASHSATIQLLSLEYDRQPVQEDE